MLVMYMSNMLVNIAGKKESSRTNILEILSQEWPLTAKQIFSRINKQAKVNVTYQAVHKSLRELEIEGIVTKKARDYSLNPSWVKKIKAYGEELDNSYALSTSQKVKIDFNKPLQIYTFNSFLELARFTISFMVDCPNLENKLGVCRCYHAWCPISLSEDEYKKLKKLLSESKFYEIVSSNTPLDNIFAGFLRDLGKIIKLGIKEEIENDSMVKGDFILQFYFPNDFKNSLSEIYKNAKQIEKLSINELMKSVLEKETKIKAVIIKDAFMADQIREKTLRYF